MEGSVAIISLKHIATVKELGSKEPIALKVGTRIEGKKYILRKIRYLFFQFW